MGWQAGNDGKALAFRAQRHREIQVMGRRPTSQHRSLGEVNGGHRARIRQVDIELPLHRIDLEARVIRFLEPLLAK